MNRPAMVALSSFRWSQDAIERAFQETEAGGVLVVAYVVDVSIAEYFTGMDVGLYPDVMEACTRDLLKGHKDAGRAILKAIGVKARARQITVKTCLAVGRFAKELLRLIKANDPRVVITCRSRRPNWAQHLQGEAVTSIARHTGCPVVEV
jgi:nucleotide-binding universal stress UspA family protein